MWADKNYIFYLFLNYHILKSEIIMYYITKKSSKHIYYLRTFHLFMFNYLHSVSALQIIRQEGDAAQALENKEPQLFLSSFVRVRVG